MFNRYFSSIRNRWLGILFLTGLLVCLGLGQAIAQTPTSANPSQLVQQGVDQYHRGNYRAAIATWETALTAYQQGQQTQHTAIVLENLARAYQAVGQTSRAIALWEQLAALYRSAQNIPEMGRIMTEMSQAYTRLGQYRQAIALLCGSHQGIDHCVPSSALQIARVAGDRNTEAAALGSLGDAQRLMGEFQPAVQALESGLAIARVNQNPLFTAAMLNSLGNAYMSLAQVNYRRVVIASEIGDTLGSDRFRQDATEQDQQALQYFQEGLAIAQAENDASTQLRVLLNAIPTHYRIGEFQQAQASLQQAKALLNDLPDSQEKVYAIIDLARLLQPTAATEVFSRTQCFDAAVQPDAIALLQQAVKVAQNMGDSRSESFALGELGHVYECQQQYPQALDLSQQARLAAEQSLSAKDSLYLWEWQTARILKTQGKATEAIALYEQAIATLETIRSDILVANRDIQFDFRDTVEPIYRQLVELRLEQTPDSTLLPPSSEAKKSVNATLRTLDSLKLAELQNYFGNDCAITTVNQEQVDLVGAESRTAVISSVILDDRTAIVASFPDGHQRLEWINLDQKGFVGEINEYRRGLERYYRNFNPQQGQKLYNWMIRPFESDLEQAQVKTLAFIQDGILRSVPMAALHDGEQFLVQKYAIATTPSLTLTDPKPLDRRRLRALALGLTQTTVIDGTRFAPLANVTAEIQAVEQALPGSTPLLDQEFTRDRLEQELTSETYPIIHIATHGEFGTEPENTFLVTGDSQKLTITDLDNLLRAVNPLNPVELLSLTACQTAVGNDRAALGLAGVAAQAGARSVLASLWSIDDAATSQLITQFYANLLNPELSKAEALQAAQRSLIESDGVYKRPAYWAPFILIGNWL